MNKKIIKISVITVLAILIALAGSYLYIKSYANDLSAACSKIAFEDDDFERYLKQFGGTIKTVEVQSFTMNKKTNYSCGTAFQIGNSSSHRLKIFPNVKQAEEFTGEDLSDLEESPYMLSEKSTVLPDDTTVHTFFLNLDSGAVAHIEFSNIAGVLDVNANRNFWQEQYLKFLNGFYYQERFKNYPVENLKKDAFFFLVDKGLI